MDERLQFVARRLAGEPMADLCRGFGISRKTGYRFLNATRMWRTRADRQKPPPASLRAQAAFPGGELHSEREA